MVSVVYAHTLDSVHNVVSSNILAANRKLSYLRHSRVFKTMMKKKGFSPLLVTPAVDAQLVKPLAIIIFEDAHVCNYTDKTVFLRPIATDAFVNKPAQVHIFPCEPLPPPRKGPHLWAIVLKIFDREEVSSTICRYLSAAVWSQS